MAPSHAAAVSGGIGGLRVLHVAEAVRGGVATYLRTLVQQQRQDAAFVDVRVLVPAGHEDELAAVRSQLITVPPAGGRLATAFALAQRARQLCAIDATDAIDVVHLHSTFAGLAGRVLRPPARALIYCPHGWAFDREGAAVMRAGVRAVESLLAPRCNAVVAISMHEFEAGRRLGLSASRLHLVRNGIDASAPAPDTDPWPKQPGLRLLFVGRFDRQKAFDVFTAVARALPNANCVAIGDYSVDAPRAHAALPANLHTPGWQSSGQVQHWMLHADVFIMPSRWEGFGLTAVEAMRAGLPVIASRVGGLQEIVDDGQTGWLVPVGDVQAIVARLAPATTAQLRVLGANGRRRASELFTAQRMHRDLLALYRQCLTGAAARPVQADAASERARDLAQEPTRHMAPEGASGGVCQRDRTPDPALASLPVSRR